MKRQIPDRPTLFKFLSLLILLIGLASAAVIYHRAGNTPYGALGYEGGYPIMPEDSKQYLRSMELYGGKANVLADELRRWFVGLWQGKALAKIIALFSIIISIGFFYAANHLPPRNSSEVHEEGPPDESG